jgi:hypothetical protein
LEVTRVGIRAIAVLAAAVLAAAFLTACGGSDSSADSTASVQGEGASADGGSQQSGGGQTQADVGAGRRSQDGSADDQGSGGSDSGPASTPLEVTGGGSEQFRVKGGDNSIQEFGDESDESELEEAAEALHGFYVARAEEDWSGACAYLAKSMVQQLEQLASQSPQLKGKGCAAVLHAFTRPLPASVRRETTVVDAGSLRTEGEQSFLIYYGEGHTPYAMPMTQEDGAWKATLLAATPLG